MPRVLALVLTAALTSTPAVVGACAVLLCAPAGELAARQDGHQGHPDPLAPPAHAHHHEMGQAAAGAVPSAQLRGVPDHDCCVVDAASAVAAAVVTSRLDVGAPIDASLTTIGADVTGAAGRQYSPPPRHHNHPPRPVPAPVVLRV